MEILREVHRQGSVTAAAEKLNVSQSALSHMIKKLEGRYNIRVWIKKGRGLFFTPAGYYLLDMAERILPELEKVDSILEEFSKGNRGVMRIGMECHPCQKWLMSVASPYLDAWPDVRFEVCTAFRFDGVNALLDHEIDVLITPDPIIHPELKFTPVFDYELVLSVSPLHPLSSHAYVEPVDLIEEELITIPVDVERLDIFTKFLIPARCRPKKHTKVETVELILQLISHNRGVAVLPDWIAQSHSQGANVKNLKLGNTGIFKSIHIGVRKGEDAIDYINGFIETTKSIYPNVT
nr:LysR family transcriptional regulator [Aeromonas caviae]